ncbi:MAG: radical SAM protein [Armatimonadetes bacterium]|nr:radical SAM protein [Armatimonadota bacterium]
MRRSRPPSFEELLAAERPTRPLPRPGRIRLRALVAAPAPYAVAMGGLSLQAVWESLLATGDVLCERAFSDWPDGAPLLPQVRLGGYDLIGVSLPYELDWLALPAMLEAGGLPVLAEERRDDAPVILAGGASVTMNPEPLAEIVDAFVIGEAEPIIPAVVEAMAGMHSRGERLAALARLPGVYVPEVVAGWKPAPLGSVQRLVWNGATDSPRTSVVVSPHAAFPERFLVETGRGCPMGCRFCLARAIYRPVRYATPGSILAAAAEGLRTTRRIGLIGAALSGLPGLGELVEELVAQGADVSLSSLRADRLTPGLLAALKRGGQVTVTIAPEAGTEALRNAIGKPISDDTLDAALGAISQAGIRDVKLYFMTNLPGELPADREAIIGLVAGWAARFPKLRFAVTLSPFVPKPWTPFEDAPFPALSQVKHTLNALASRLRRQTRVDVRPGSARLAAVQAALARGGRNVGRAIVAAAAKGGGYSTLKRALRAEGADLDEPYHPPEVKPWREALGVAEVCGSADAGGENQG